MSGPAAPSGESARLVQDALAHLFDPIYLQRHPLARTGLTAARGAGASSRSNEAGAALRQWLLDSIERLRPAEKVGRDSRTWRRHELLRLRYVEALDAIAVQQQLGISKSQYYEEHRIAVDAVASLLREALTQDAPVAHPAAATRENGATGLSGAHEAANTSPASSHQRLPRPLTSFIGREREVSEVRRHLEERLEPGHSPRVRLLTLTGPAGTGKTRLALEVAASLAADGRHIVFVDLSPLTDPEAVVPAMANALGVRDGAGARGVEQLQGRIGDDHFLLVLDNFEHVLPASGGLGGLLTACPNLQALVTSRTALPVYGAHELVVSPLAAPPEPGAPDEDQRSMAPGGVRVPNMRDFGMQFPAVRLFVERAQAVDAGFTLTDENASAVVQICRRLDGLPLAIELAAGRIRLLTPQQMLPRLDSRLALLSSGALDRPDRQRSLRGAIAWSYELLGAAERRLFRRLAVFAGGCPPEAVPAVCATLDGPSADLLDELEALAAHSLIRHDVVADGDSRFTMLETIKEFASEQLKTSGEEDEARHAHSLWCLSYVETAEQAIHGPDQQRWLDRLEREHGNIQQAISWWTIRAAAGDEDSAERALRLCGAMWRFWPKRGHMTENRRWLDQILWLRSAAAPTVHRARALITAGALAAEQGDFSEARRVFEEALAIRRRIGDAGAIAAMLNNLGSVALCQEDFAAARALLEECIEIRRVIGSPIRLASALSNLGMVEEYEGHLPRARECYEQSLKIRRAEGDEWGVSETLGNLSSLACEEGEPELACGYLTESLALRRRLGDPEGIAFLLEVCAGLAAIQGHAEHALRFAGAAEALRETLHAPLAPAHLRVLDRRLQIAREQLHVRAQEEALAAGRAMSLDEAVEFACVVLQGGQKR